MSLTIPTAGHSLGEMLLQRQLSLEAELFLHEGRHVGVESCDTLSALGVRVIFSSNLFTAFPIPILIDKLQAKKSDVNIWILQYIPPYSAFLYDQS